MKITLRRIALQDWLPMARDAHLVCFGTHRDALKERIDYALLAVDPDDRIMGYVTVMELDEDMVYWQYGGMFPSYKDTIHSYRAYREALAWCGERYNRVSTLIKNDNLPMLKFAMKIGFRIIGSKHVNGNVLLEHSIEFKKGE